MSPYNGLKGLQEVLKQTHKKNDGRDLSSLSCQEGVHLFLVSGNNIIDPGQFQLLIKLIDQCQGGMIVE
mgnify:CR=1 FL=1